VFLLHNIIRELTLTGKRVRFRSMDETLGELLRAQRLAEGISLRDMAERAGVTGSYLSLLELDKRSPSIDVLRKLVEVYNLPREICEACEGKGWVEV